MYTIRPFSAGVCGFEGPHPEIAIMSIAAIAILRAEFFDREVVRRPEVFCTG